VSNGFGMIIEMLVAILLALTIAYCISLNRRLKLLKADEQSLRATISELVTATEIAERAIAGLKLTVEECEAGLGARLRSADRFTADLDRSLAAGKDLYDRLARIVVAGGTIPKTPPGPAAKRAATAPPAPRPSMEAPRGGQEAPAGAQAVAAAAQAFAERLRVKVHGLAA
jgi:Domain of unknown function (DUF6468)